MTRGANPGRSESIQPMAASRFKGAAQGAKGKMTALAGIAGLLIVPLTTVIIWSRVRSLTWSLRHILRLEALMNTRFGSKVLWSHGTIACVAVVVWIVYGVATIANARVNDEVRMADAAGRRGVSMSCYTTDNGHRIRIDINNTNRTSRSCKAACSYVTNQGERGVQNCESTVTGGYSGEFCSTYHSNKIHRITSGVSFDCSE